MITVLDRCLVRADIDGPDVRRPRLRDKAVVDVVRPLPVFEHVQRRTRFCALLLAVEVMIRTDQPQ